MYKTDGTFIQVDDSESDSESDSEPEEEENLQEFEESGIDGEVETEKSEKEIKEENLMAGSSNYKDSGKLSGFSQGDEKINQIFDDYTGADNDDFMKQLIEDYGTKDK